MYLGAMYVGAATSAPGGPSPRSASTHGGPSPRSVSALSDVSAPFVLSPRSEPAMSTVSVPYNVLYTYMYTFM